MINLDITFLFQVINFVVLLFVLNVFLYKPIRKVLAERTGEIEGARERALSVDRDVQARLAEYEARLREMKASASDERGAMKKEAQAEEQAILEKARKEASDSLGIIKGKVANEAAEARAQLRGQAEVLAQEICVKVLGRGL